MAVARREDVKRLLEVEDCVSIDQDDSHSFQTVKGYKLPPLVGALRASAKENAASFHFPGHNRGQAAPLVFTQLIGKRPYLHDLPELPELDNLFNPEGPILEAQEKAAELFGASETWFLVGGSTCGIQAAIMATCSPGCHLILPRNSHISAVSAMVEKAIEELKMKGENAGAVLVVSPTYHGICSNITEISQVCHSHNIPLIVDEAHGAHLGFHRLLPKSALSQGADLVIQSTHKVLCSLTQSSMLHMSRNLVNRDKVCRCLQTVQSSSPSYLLLASLDAARAQVSENKENVFNEAVELAVEAKRMMNEIPNISVLDIASFPQFPAIDPLRVTIGTKLLGLSGFEADDILTKGVGLVSELVGTQSITLAFNLGTRKEHVLRLIFGLKHLVTVSADTECTVYSENDYELVAPFGNSNMSLSPREAFFADKRKVAIKDSIGQISGELLCPYPPGIPVLIPGEVISEAALDYLIHLNSKGAVITGASDCSLSSLLVINLFLSRCSLCPGYNSAKVKQCIKHKPETTTNIYMQRHSSGNRYFTRRLVGNTIPAQYAAAVADSLDTVSCFSRLADSLDTVSCFSRIFEQIKKPTSNFVDLCVYFRPQWVS
ncbi:OLC1v1035843C1 [Oldenlandia corymbosa var. corymbosa]|uniref:OLC1v1035843C1 n=1 Tax=Oldenlandia corymbosa var. corymbosa TaxID=529605 RepID=A0AAV1CTY9_OLDCO|nr:OLC1v1035843C1 [Oldenlandia corymbosa var. corymbosa]